MLDAHYKGKINISDYWHVGDTRVMHLSAMTGSDSTYGENHVEQDMAMVIIGIEHDDLKETINGKTKAAITLQCREVLGLNEAGRHYGGTDQWSANPRRTWLNNTFIAALPSDIQPLVKTVIKKNLANHTDNTAGNDTEDKAFFTSCSEMFKNTEYSVYYKGSPALEGEQYPYYNSDARRIKYFNDGVSNDIVCYWWLRSPAINENYNYFVIYDNGKGFTVGSTNQMGIAPAFCL